MLNAIARGIKRLGDTRTLDQLRADTPLHLLTGGTPTPVIQAKPSMRMPAKSRAAKDAADTAKATTANDRGEAPEPEPRDAGVSAGSTETAAERPEQRRPDDAVAGWISRQR